MGRGKVSNSLTLLALAAPVALGGCAMTSTYGTGQAPEMALFSEMTGGLLSKNKKAPIDYQPRAPLVMPGSDDLPAPVETATTADPNWPADPGSRALVVSGNNPTPQQQQEDYRRLRPLAGLFGEGNRNTRPNDDRSYERDEFYRFVQESNGQSDSFRKSLADAKGYSRTERRYLTDPPTGYRDAAATAPTGEIETGVKKKSFWRRILPGNG